MKVGILRGEENSFPEALIERINQKSAERKLEVSAEFIKIEVVRMAGACDYRLIIDRISHEVPFYRAYLKNAMLSGTEIINNPFWWSADDKFFNYSIAHKIGVPIPKTVMLPHQAHPPYTSSQSMRNLVYPIDWYSTFKYVGFPAFLKPHAGGGWKHVYKVNNEEEFFNSYHQTGTLCMVLQEGIEFTEYYRCYTVGRKHVHIMRYDPGKAFFAQYVPDNPPPAPELKEKIIKYCLMINHALGYDLNTCEFAVRDGIPYAIDFGNPAPDCDLKSVTPTNFAWVVDKMSELAIERALQPRKIPSEFLWSKFFGAPEDEPGAENKSPRKVSGSARRVGEKRA
jgi:glutathione synthase/RimK-type ligase-like ATP-grasp enzyme